MSALTLPAPLVPRARAGTLAHAYILTADAPEVLAAAATATAAALVCGGEGGPPPCGTCRHCRKVERGVHPDVAAVAPEPGKELPVDRIRALRRDVYVRPNEAARKVYVLENAHKMNASAQNAFLKVLEDGPDYAAFLLLTPSPAALLTTVRSRCELVRVAGAARGDDPELSRRADELAGLLLGTDPWRLIARCAEHEKDKREDVAALFEETRRVLARCRDPKTTARAVRLAGTLRELTEQLNGNANVGCVWGALWAKAGEV